MHNAPKMIRTPEQQFNDLIEFVQQRQFTVEFREVTESIPHPDRDVMNPEHERLRLGYTYHECAVKHLSDPEGIEILMDDPERACHELSLYYQRFL